MSSPLAKPSPIRRGTLNFGLRRKSSAASLTPSIGSASPPNTAGLPNGSSTNGNGNHTEEPSADDNASVSSKTDKRPPKKRMFSILAPRGSKSSMNPDGVLANGHTADPSEASADNGSDNGVSTTANGTPSLQRSSIGSGFFSSQRRGSSEKKHAAELAQEKEKLEEQVKGLTSEKATLEAALEAEKAETAKLTAEKETREAEWNEEREKIKGEVGAQLVEREGEVTSLTATVAELKEELEKTRQSEKELAAFKESVEQDQQGVKEEKEALETKLAGVQKTIDLKDATIEKMIAEAAELQEQLNAALEEAKKLKDEKEAWVKKETDMQTEIGKIKGAGGCSIM